MERRSFAAARLVVFANEEYRSRAVRDRLLRDRLRGCPERLGAARVPADLSWRDGARTSSPTSARSASRTTSTIWLTPWPQPGPTSGQGRRGRLGIRDRVCEAAGRATGASAVRSNGSDSFPIATGLRGSCAPRTSASRPRSTPSSTGSRPSSRSSSTCRPARRSSPTGCRRPRLWPGTPSPMRRT